MNGGVQEHYWTNSAHKPYTDGIDGEELSQCLTCLCVVYFVARLFSDGIVIFLIVGVTLGLIMHLLNVWNSGIRPPKYAKSHIM